MNTTVQTKVIKKFRPSIEKLSSYEVLNNQKVVENEKRKERLIQEIKLDNLSPGNDSLKNKNVAKQAVWWAKQTFKAFDKKDHLKLLAVLYEFFSSDFLKQCNVINFKGTMNIFKRPITKLVDTL
jgi:predicted nucleotidyltransferase